MSRLTRDGDREMSISPVQLTTRRIDNHTRLIDTLILCMMTFLYIDSHCQLLTARILYIKNIAPHHANTTCTVCMYQVFSKPFFDQPLLFFFLSDIESK